MKQNFLDLFNYNDWANGVLLEHLLKQNNIPERTVQLSNHIISSQDLWLERIKSNTQYAIDLWESNSLHECLVLSKESTHTWVKYISNSTEKSLRNFFEYENSKGKLFNLKVSQVINHVLTHSHYHRGQINVILKKELLPTISLDYIDFLRN